MILYLFSLTFIAFLVLVKPLTSPSVNPSNTNFQTGLTTLISAGGTLNTIVQPFNFVYGNVMLSNSLRAAIGVLS